MGFKFRPIRGYTGFYGISEKGEVLSIRSGVLLKVQVNRKGYHRVTLCRKGISKTHTLHRLVAKAFIPNLNKPQVNHIDSDKNNNHYTNLEWVTNRENQAHAWANNRRRVRGSSQWNSILNEKQAVEIRKNKSNLSAKELSKNYKVGLGTIYNILKGASWKHTL